MSANYLFMIIPRNCGDLKDQQIIEALTLLLLLRNTSKIFIGLFMEEGQLDHSNSTAVRIIEVN